MNGIAQNHPPPAIVATSNNITNANSVNHTHNHNHIINNSHLPPQPQPHTQPHPHNPASMTSTATLGAKSSSPFISNTSNNATGPFKSMSPIPPPNFKSATPPTQPVFPQAIPNMTSSNPFAFGNPHDPNSLASNNDSTNSITGKRKRADSSPAKDSVPITRTSLAQKLKIMATLRSEYLSSLTQYDAGISLLEKPVSIEVSAHEAKKTRILPKPNGPQTLRQRLTSETFYTSLPRILKDVNAVADEALESVGVSVGIAVEDQMQDDEPDQTNGNQDKVDRIRKFKEIAQSLTDKFASDYPELNMLETDDIKEEDDDEDDDDDVLNEDPITHSSTAFAFINDKQIRYGTVRNPNEPNKEIDPESLDGLRKALNQTGPSNINLVTIHASQTLEPRTYTIKDLVSSKGKTQATPLSVPRSRVEKLLVPRIPTSLWLDYGPFSSFAPTCDQKDPVVSDNQRSRLWYAGHGKESLRKVLEDGGALDAEDDQFEDLKKFVAEYEPTPIDPALLDEAIGPETSVEKSIRELSDILNDLRGQQFYRHAQDAGSKASKPKESETQTYEKALEKITKMLLEMPAETREIIEEMVDRIPLPAEEMPAQVSVHSGSMKNVRPMPSQPPPAQPQQQQYPTTTTRVSYVPNMQSNGQFSPSVRIISGPTQNATAYSRHASNQPNYPQTPASRQTYNNNYYPNQGNYAQPQFTQSRQPAQPHPQFQQSSFSTGSPFSRAPNANVPRMASSAQPSNYNIPPQTPQLNIRNTYTTASPHSQTPQVHHQGTARRVSMMPQQQQQPQPIQRPAPTQQAPYTPGHAQYTGIAQQTQQSLMFKQQQQAQQQTIQSYPQPPIRPAGQQTPQNPSYHPPGYQSHGRIFKNTHSTPHGGSGR